jgi:hypothetical protein
MAKTDGRQTFPATDERRPVEFLDRTTIGYSPDKIRRDPSPEELEHYLYQ